MERIHKLETALEETLGQIHVLQMNVDSLRNRLQQRKRLSSKVRTRHMSDDDTDDEHSNDQRKLNELDDKILNKWILQYRGNRYPTIKERMTLCRHADISPKQLSDWIVNTRRQLHNKSDVKAIQKDIKNVVI